MLLSCDYPFSEIPAGREGMLLIFFLLKVYFEGNYQEGK
jgi:hypothetical protein